MSLLEKIKQKWIDFRTKLVPEETTATVYKGTDEFSARILKMKLEDEGIQVQFIDQRDSSYNAFGYVYLKVFIKDEVLAKSIIDNNNNE